MIRKYSCNSGCRASCRIFNQKHNWVKPATEELLRKFQQIRNDKNCSCALCNKAFKSLTELDNHIATKHVDGESEQLVKATYKLCEKSVEQLKNLEEHIQATHNVRNCEKSLEKKTELVKHQQNTQLSEDIFIMDSSDISMTQFCSNSSKEESFQSLCNVCLISFETGEELKEHMPKHKDRSRPVSILKKL